MSRARSPRNASIAEAWSGVSSRGRPTFAASASTIAARIAASAASVDLDPWRRVPRPLAAPTDHADLEGEQLVEGEPPQGGIARLERRRVVGLLQGDVDRREPLGLADRGRQVLRVLVSRAVERLADGRSEPCRGQTRGQRVDGHDPPGVEHLGVALRDLELGVVEGELAAEPLDLAGHDDRVARFEPALDVAPPEPGCLGGAGLVGQRGHGPLDSPAERGLDVDVGDLHARGCDRSFLDPDQIPESLHLAQVVVPAWQVEQQVAHRVPARAGLPARRSVACAVSPDLPSGACSSPAGSLGVTVGTVPLATPIRRRSGSGSAADRHAAARRPPRTGSAGSAWPRPRPRPGARRCRRRP